MSYRSNRFNGSMASLDKFIDKFGESSKIRTLSDNEQGVKRMLDAIDTTPQSIEREEEKYQNFYHRKIDEAKTRLIAAKLFYLIPVLLLIIENKNNRAESIGTVSKRTYFRNRDKLLKFFVAL